MKTIAFTLTAAALGLGDRGGKLFYVLQFLSLSFRTVDDDGVEKDGVERTRSHSKPRDEG